MAEREIRERDILVAGNEYAYVQDLTKGDIVLYVGPTKISLSNTERLVELRNGRFVPARGDDASTGVHAFVVATSAQYIVLDNPAKSPDEKPVKGSNSAAELLVGRQVVVPGPATFPLWPGQRARVIDGHRLGDGDYLLIRVRERTSDGDPAIGTDLIIKGTDTSFYVPRTGLEVLPHAQGFVRRSRRMRSGVGLHLRVLRSFIAGADDQVPPGEYFAGQDVFLADRDGYFFPSDRFDIISEVFAVPLAESEGLYVRDLETGAISTIMGPRTYLPDPTRVEIVERTVDGDKLALYGQSDHSPDRTLSVSVPPNHAVMVTAKGRREVVRGPQIRPLDFDEELEVMTLSTGRPKCDDLLLSTCFLQLEGNKVSDVVKLETRDHVELNVSLSYRVSFITRDGSPEKWFYVKNYVGLLCDHLGSMLRAIARTVGIEDFHAKGTDILRAALLGDRQENGKRSGRLFEENDMLLYDVEVLDIHILDQEVESLLSGAQRGAIQCEIDRKREELRLAAETLREQVNRQVYLARIETCEIEANLESARRQVTLAEASSRVEAQRTEALGRAQTEAESTELISRARSDAATRDQDLELRGLSARVEAFREEMAAMHPELVATLTNLGNKQVAAELTRNLAPMSLLGGTSVAEIAERLLGSLPIGSQSRLAKEALFEARPKNGKSSSPKNKS